MFAIAVVNLGGSVLGYAKSRKELKTLTITTISRAKTFKTWQEAWDAAEVLETRYRVTIVRMK